MSTPTMEKPARSIVEMTEADPLLAPDEVAKIVHLKVKTLANWRVEQPQKGPKCKKVGGRILYRQSDVMSWLDGQDYEAVKTLKQAAPVGKSAEQIQREKKRLAIKEERDALWQRIAQLNEQEEDLK